MWSCAEVSQPRKIPWSDNVLRHDLGPHINYMTPKDNQKRGSIKQNLKRKPQELKRLAYLSLVWSGMEYASIVWYPHLCKDKHSLQRIHRRAARITRTYDQITSVTALLQQLQLEPLEEEHRCINWLAFLYKIVNEQVVVPPDKLDLIVNNRPVRGTVTQQRLHIPRCWTTEYQNSLSPRTIPEWNSLPNAITSAHCFSILI